MSDKPNPQARSNRETNSVYVKVGGWQGKDEKTYRISYNLIVFLFAFAFVVLLFHRGDTFIHNILEDFAQKLADRKGMSLYLVKGWLLFASIPLFAVVAIQSPWDLFCDWRSLQFSKSGTKALLLLAVSGVYGAAYFLVLGYASREAYAYKFCADIPEDVVTSDTEGKEHLYGHQFHHCTDAEVRFLRNKHDHSLAANEVRIPDWHHIHWKDAGAGTTILWYSQRPDGYHFFNHSGTDPEGGAELAPVTKRVVAEYQAEQQKQEIVEQDSASLTQAQTSFDANDFKGAVQACTTVLSHGASDPCDKIKHEASVQWAHQVVDKGQAQLQQAQYDAAIRSAQQAIDLDQNNQPAKDLLEVAKVLKTKASVN